MDKEFQTTFIPKKSLASEPSQQPKRKSKPAGIFSLIGTLVFVVALVAAGGVFAYERFLENRISTLRDSLERAERSFEPSLIIELQDLDTRLAAAENLLNQHNAVSPVFRVIETATLKSIQYGNFDFKFNEGSAEVSMKGEAGSYQTIAEQSLIFGENRFIEDHIFSNFNLTSGGRVAFDLKISIGSNLLLFTESLGEVPVGATTIQDIIEIPDPVTNESDDIAGAENDTNTTTDAGDIIPDPSADTDNTPLGGS